MREVDLASHIHSVRDERLPPRAWLLSLFLHQADRTVRAERNANILRDGRKLVLDLLVQQLPLDALVLGMNREQLIEELVRRHHALVRTRTKRDERIIGSVEDVRPVPVVSVAAGHRVLLLAVERVPVPQQRLDTLRLARLHKRA